MEADRTRLAGFGPSHGVNFAFGEALPAASLARILCRIAGFIQDVEPYGTTLRRYDDWREHDGPHFARGDMAPHDLFAMVESPRALLQAMPGDENVFVGVAPLDGRWYLRMYLAWDDSGYTLAGRCDITVPESMAGRFRSEVVAQVETSPIEQTATSW
jgi:hypothetical protein